MRVLITGASRGIGLALTQKALDMNYKVFAISRQKMDLAHRNLEVIQADITKPSDLDLIASSKSLGEGLDILINNAGVLLAKNKTEETAQTFSDSFHLNATTPFLLSQKLLPVLMKSKNPKVVQISTMMSSIQDNSSGGYYSYRSSKMALNMITQSLSIDHPEITFGLLHPGWVQTEMGGASAPVKVDQSAVGLWKVISELQKGSPLKLMDFRGRVLPW
jgi:NAD(P)-dependent dehydrogenase (short-subunit alcohol dehydrogenase family)